MIPHLPAIASLLVGASLAITPTFRNGTVLFGVHVAPAWLASKDAGRASLIYRLQIAAWTLAAAALNLPGIALLLAGALAAFLIGRRSALAHPALNPPLRTASLIPACDSLPGGIAAAALPFLILAAAALWLNLHWSRIPGRFPVHFDLAGHPNRWSARTPKGVFGPLLIGASVLVVTVTSAIAIVRGAPRGSANSERYRRANLLVLIGAMWLMALLFAYIALMPILPFRLPLLALPAIVVGGALLLVIPALRLQSTVEGVDDASRDSGWKFGLLYYNPEDSALMVQRRFGSGYTLNMANPMAWVFTAAVLGLPALLIALLKGLENVG